MEKRRSQRAGGDAGGPRGVGGLRAGGWLRPGLQWASGSVLSSFLPRIQAFSGSQIRSPMAEQYIYVMKDLRKVYPPNREVLKDIWLSFFPGAKIGVLGLNGAGKSTLLKIMA